MNPALLLKLLLIAILGLVLSGCLHPGKPLIAERSPVYISGPDNSGDPPRGIYVVQKGDTMYSIAWRFQLDYKGLARANGVRAPYRIVPGQKLNLVTQLTPSARVREPAGRPPASGGAARPETRTPAVTKPPPQVAAPTTSADWVWPVSLKPYAEFGRSNKGLDFRLGEDLSRRVTVRAANGGEVVYAGNGIGGFERLVIVKHSNSLLSAYGFDGTLRVAEKQNIKAGSELADIKNRGRSKQSLHFELRKDGQPINPRQFLR